MPLMKIYIGWSLNYFEEYILHGRVFVLFSHFPVQPHKIARNLKTQTVFLGRDNKGSDQSVQMLLSGSLFSPMKKVIFSYDAGQSFKNLQLNAGRTLVFWVSNQVLHKSGCTATEDG